MDRSMTICTILAEKKSAPRTWCNRMQALFKRMVERLLRCDFNSATQRIGTYLCIEWNEKSWGSEALTQQPHHRYHSPLKMLEEKHKAFVSNSLALLNPVCGECVCCSMPSNCIQIVCTIWIDLLSLTSVWPVVSLLFTSRVRLSSIGTMSPLVLLCNWASGA